VRVCPVTDEIRGEEIKAYVVPVPGSTVESLGPCYDDAASGRRQDEVALLPPASA
jgi:hypothetical protein